MRKIRTSLLVLAGVGAMVFGGAVVAPQALAADNVTVKSTFKWCYDVSSYGNLKVTSVWDDTSGSEATLKKVTITQDRPLKPGKQKLMYRPSPTSDWKSIYPDWSGGAKSGHYIYTATPKIGEQIAMYGMSLKDLGNRNCVTNRMEEPDGA